MDAPAAHGKETLMTMPHSLLDSVVVGNAGIDTNVYPYGDEIDFSVESNFTTNIDYVGQAGGYATRGYARLGYRTAFIGAVGDDPSGRFIRETFAQDSIDVSGIFTDPTGTARSINFMYADGRRKNFYDGKAHMTLQAPAEPARTLLKRARLAHFNIPNWARALLPVAREADTIIACDLQDVTDPDDPYRADFVEAADILFISSTNHPDPSPIIRQFMEGHSDRIVVCGMGARGCAVGTRKGIRLFDAIRSGPPVVDTNGAGDSLAVGFLSRYVLEGAPVEESVRAGQIAARHACTLKAQSDTLITRQELEDRLRETIT